MYEIYVAGMDGLNRNTCHCINSYSDSWYHSEAYRPDVSGGAPSISVIWSWRFTQPVIGFIAIFAVIFVVMLGRWLEGLPERRAEKRRNKMIEALGVTEKIKAIRAAEEKKRSSEQNL
jgi:hypothetical protein